MIDPRFRYPKKTVRVNGYRMAYAEAGDPNGDPVIFLHGNATSSYMWRNIMPYLEGNRRLIALDNIGQGNSDKLANSGPDSYALEQHQEFIDGALDALGVSDNVTLVMHDWGGPLGINWARRNPGRLKGLAHAEIVVCNHPSWDASANCCKRCADRRAKNWFCKKTSSSKKSSPAAYCAKSTMPP